MKKFNRKTLFGVLITLLCTLSLPLSANAADFNFIYLQLVDDAGNPVDNVYWGSNFELILSETTPGSGIYYNYSSVYVNPWADNVPRFLLYDNVTLTSDYKYDKTNATVIGASTDQPLEVVDKFLRYEAKAGSTKPFKLRLGDYGVFVYYNSNTGRLVIDDFVGQFIAKSSFTTDASYEDDLTELSAKKVRYLSQVDIPAGAFDITLKPQLYWYENANDYKLSFDADGFALNNTGYESWNYLHLTCDNWEGGHILSYGSEYANSDSNEPTAISFCRIESLDKLYLDLQASDCTSVPDDSEIAAWNTFLKQNADQPGVFKTESPISCEKFAIYLNMGSKYGLSSDSYAARIYDEGYINENTGFGIRQASCEYINDFIKPIKSRNYLHWMANDGSAINSEFTVDLINQTVTVYADPEQYGFEDSYRFKEKALYLVGSPQGWDINNDSMKLVNTDNQNYKGTFYIEPNEEGVAFRFFSSLGQWSTDYSIGSYSEDFYSLPISIADGEYYGDAYIGGLGNWLIENWAGGYIRFEVNLNSWHPSVTFTKVDAAEEWTAEDAAWYELPTTIAVAGSVTDQQDASDTLAGDGKGVYTYTYELPAGRYDILFADYAEGQDAPYYYGANYEGRPALDISDAKAFISTRKSVNEPNHWSLDLDVKSSVKVTLDVNKNCVKFKKKALEEGGISTNLADEEVLPTEYYDLRGIRVSHPNVPGIYLKRCGSHVSKVLVK
jgi:hypothetical protein